MTENDDTVCVILSSSGSLCTYKVGGGLGLQLSFNTTFLLLQVLSSKMTTIYYFILNKSNQDYDESVYIQNNFSIRSFMFNFMPCRFLINACVNFLHFNFIFSKSQSKNVILPVIACHVQECPNKRKNICSYICPW